MFGALVAGIYGILHDQITYTISNEYFTKFKFDQFAHANPGFGGNRVFASVIGFLATWWIGCIMGWVLARLSIFADGSTHLPSVLIWKQFLLMLGIAILAGVAGYLVATFWKGIEDRELWREFETFYDIQNLRAFVKVGMVHNASYIGGVIGGIVAVVNLLIQKRRITAKKNV